MNDWLDAEAHANRALEMFERGRWAEAEAELRKALSLHPDHPEWHFNLGLTLEAAGRDAEALSTYERAIDLMPAEIEPLIAAGVVANRLGRFDQAVTWLSESLRQDPRSEPSHAHLMESHIRLGRYEEAETTFYLAQQALEDPSAHCLAMMGEAQYVQERYERANWCFREAVKIDPGFPRLRARLAAVYAAMDRPQRALQLFLREVRDDPGNVETLLDFGDLLVQLNRFPEAAEKFRRVLELEPANVDAHFRLADIAFICQRYEHAHLEYELVLKLDSQYPQVRLALAEALLQRDRVQAAAAHLRDELDLYRADLDDDTPPPDLLRLGRLLLDAAMPQDAADVLERAEVPADQELRRLRSLALARFRSDDRDGGVSISRRIIRLDPHSVYAMHNLALAALEENRLSVAAGWIRRGLRVDRHDVGLRRLRMRVLLARVGKFFRIRRRK